MSKKLNLEIEQGATYSNDIQLLDILGHDFDVAGWTSRGKVRKHYASNVAYSFTTLLTTGNFHISMTAAQTSLIPSGLYVYDLEIENSENVVRKILAGMITVSPEVTS